MTYEFIWKVTKFELENIPAADEQVEMINIRVSRALG